MAVAAAARGLRPALLLGALLTGSIAASGCDRSTVRAAPRPGPPKVAAPAAAVGGSGGGRVLSTFDNQKLPLGKSLEVVAGRHYWAFAAKPGEKYRFEAEWPDGKLELRAGSDWRDKGEEDGDDAKNVTLAKVETAGAHRFAAAFEIGPKANTGFVSVTLSGSGVDPIVVRIDGE